LFHFKIADDFFLGFEWDRCGIFFLKVRREEKRGHKEGRKVREEGRKGREERKNKRKK
jgi:hypothetical protein